MRVIAGQAFVIMLALAGGGGFSAGPATAATAAGSGKTSAALIGGPWAGTSTCVGDRPACKNENVVYRFVPVEGQPHQVRLLGDKVVEGKRVPMGALVFEVNEAAGTLRCEFRRAQTHGVWTFKISGETLTGSLVILPEGTRARDVKVSRVKAADVPEAPADKEYEE